MSILEKSVNKIIQSLSRGEKRAQAAQVFLFVLLVGPVMVVATFFYIQLDVEFAKNLHEARLSQAHLASVLLRERINKLVDLGVSFTTRDSLRQYVEEGNWQKAIEVVEGAPDQFADIERIFITDDRGTLMSDAPAIGGVRGRNFAYQQWYRGVSFDWRPYVSPVYARETVPQYNVIAVAVPIFSLSSSPSEVVDENIAGIMVLQIKLDTLQDWSRDIASEGGTVYFLDDKYNVAAHPNIQPQGDIVSVRRTELQSQMLDSSGIFVAKNPFNGTEHLVAYELISEYGWTAVVSQSKPVAYVARNIAARNIIFLATIIILANLVLVYIFVQALRKLNQFRQKEEAVFASIGDGVFAIDRNFSITRFNRAASRITGWPEQEAIGRPMREVVKFVRESDKKEDIAFIEEAMLYGEPREMQADMLLLRKDGEMVHVEDSAAPIFNEEGEASGAIIVFRDVEKEVQLERERYDFISVVSHQLKTPPSVIEGYMDILKEELSKKTLNKVGEYIDNILAANRQMLDLARGLLDVLKVDFGKAKVRPEPIDISDLISRALDQFDALIARKNISLSTNFPPQLRAIDVDGKLLNMVLYNLISNAIKYTPENGNISVSVEQDEDDALIKVADSGVGIPEDERDKLFTKFTRGSNVKGVEGTGLGLYIVKTIADRTGCRVWFESKEVEGTTFFFSIPSTGMKASIKHKGAELSSSES